MRKLAFLSAASVIAFLGARAFGIFLLAADLPKPKPFTAEVRDHRYGLNGELLLTVMFTHARRTDGSTVTVYTHTDPDGKPAITKDIFDLSAKKRIGVNGLTESLSSTSLSDDQVRFRRQMETACNSKKTESLPPGHANLKNNGESGLFLGMTVYRVPVKDTVDTWQAPDLACYPVMFEYVRQTDDGRRSRNTKQVVNVTLGEPNPSLFTVPSWPELDPAATDAEYARKYGKRLFSDRALHVRQTLYQQRHK